MRIDFFEEFPTEENLRKAKLISFSSTVYLAARSLKKFRELEKKLHRINQKLEAAYWPILKKSYWVSPFSYSHELESLIKDLKKNKKHLKVLIDLELPMLNKKLFLRNLFCFFKNRNLIKKIFRDAKEFNIDILTAECPLTSKIKMRLLGISYPIEKHHHKRAVMFYSSMIKKESIKDLKKSIVKEHRRYGKNFQVGLGVIATGILGNEPILSPEDLDKDLRFLKKHGIERAVVFRVGGLSREYVRFVKKYL